MSIFSLLECQDCKKEELVVNTQIGSYCLDCLKIKLKQVLEE